MTTRSNKPKLSGEARETASRMWKAGASARDIGVALGVSRSTIVGIAFRDRVNFPSKGKGRGYTRKSAAGRIVEWTDDRIDRAASMWADGLQIVQIADALGTTHASVKGIVRRRRDRFSERTRGRTEGEKMPPKREKPDWVRGVKTGPKVPTIVPSAFDLSRIQHAKLLHETGDHECKWPLTENGPHLFCAEVVADGSSWCEHHYHRSVGAGTRSEQNAVWQAGRVAA